MSHELLITDYIFSRVRDETGLWFDLADAKEIKYSGVIEDINSAYFMDGETFLFITIGTGPYIQNQVPLCEFEWQNHTLTCFRQFREDSRHPIDDDRMREIVLRAVEDFSDLESTSNFVKMLLMELHGKNDEGNFRWVHESADRLGGSVDCFPEYNGKYRDNPNFRIFKREGENWAQIRLKERLCLENAMSVLDLESALIEPRNTCQKHFVSQHSRDAFGIDSVYMKHRAF